MGEISTADTYMSSVGVLGIQKPGIVWCAVLHQLVAEDDFAVPIFFGPNNIPILLKRSIDVRVKVDYIVVGMTVTLVHESKVVILNGFDDSGPRGLSWRDLEFHVIVVGDVLILNH